jgi:uncharacterized protein YecE (DUF72 family)
MEVLAGTSGFAFKEWKGSFYPEKLPQKKMLDYYAGQFRTVEINNTFYRLPKRSMLEGWAGKVPDGFQFVIKASRRITHFSRLKQSSQEPLGFLMENTAVLGDKLGAVLFQLPPNLKKDLPRLEAFLPHLPVGRRFTFEFRHESWLDDEVYESLRSHNIALCSADVQEKAAPVVPTADWGYLRLRRVGYDDAELAGWVEQTAAQPWKTVYVFFKHEEQGTGPKLAKRFLELIQSG